MSSKPLSSPGSEAPQSSEKDDVDDEDLSKLPAHIQSVIDGLLDFNHFIGLQAAMRIADRQDEDAVPPSAYKPDGVTKSERARESEFVESAQLLAGYAQSAGTQNASEWRKLFRAVMTERMESTYYGSNVHKSIACAAFDAPHESPTTSPTPGLYFGFPVQESDKRAATGFRDDSSFDNYTREQLAQLTTHGLHCVLDVPSPSSVDEAMAQTTSKEPQPQLICFPWAIVEAYGVVKSPPEANDVSFASAVSHVSAAASTALSMFERLAKFADEKHEGRHIPPVIAITVVGAHTTVWLAYCEIVDDKIRDHKMISIWEGTITKIWDAIQFCRIIDNLFFWAQHCLKPKVTQYLSQWRLRYCPDVPNIYSQLEMDTRTAEMVHQIQDRLSALGLSPNEDLPALVRQAVVFQEVMRSGNREVKADSTSKEEEKLPAAIPLPSRPRDNSLEAALSRLGVSFEEPDPKIRPKEKEILHQGSDFIAGKSEKGTAESSKPDNNHIPPLKLPSEYRIPLLVFPDKAKESTGESSTVLENTTATPINVLINKQISHSKSPPIAEADGRGNDKVSLSDPRQIKASSAEGKKSPLPGPSKEPDNASYNLVQRTLRSMALRVENGHVLSLRRQKQKRRTLDLLPKRKLPLYITNPSNSLPRKDPDKENSTDRPSSSSNLFVSKTFKFNCKVTPWLDLDMHGPGMPRIHRHGPYPTLGVGPVECIEYPRRIVFHSDLRSMNPAPQPVPMESPPPPPVSPLKVKIPWKGTNIIVKLPPVSPALVSSKRKSDSQKI